MFEPSVYIETNWLGNMWAIRLYYKPFFGYPDLVESKYGDTDLKRDEIVKEFKDKKEEYVKYYLSQKYKERRIQI